MPNSSRRRTFFIIVVMLLLALLLVRCPREKPKPVTTGPAATAIATTAQPSTAAPATKEPAEILSPATLQMPPTAGAGAVVSIAWTGPNNRGDYLTFARKAAPDSAYVNSRETREGSPLDLPAPIEPGEWEVRYVAARSHTVLGRAAITIAPAGATLAAAESAIAGTSLSIVWTGPDNAGDYVTVVAKGTADGQYGNYTYTSKGSPLNVVLPVETGDAELRYVTGQGSKVLARRPVKIVGAEVSISVAAEAVAGALVSMEWTGPNNPGDYLTFVKKSAADGQYGNSTYTNKGSPLSVTAPIDAGDFEARYMSGQGARVLARRPIRIVAAQVSLSAPAEAVAGTTISVNWTGPNNLSDYITLVSRTAADGQHGNSTYTVKGSPLTVLTPIDAGDVEVRYMAGQGARVLARRPIRIVAAEITLSAPAEAAAGSAVTVTWTGPNNPGDYITVVAKATGDTRYGAYTYTTKGSPLTVPVPKEAGEAEVRYVSGQGSKVLQRRAITINPGK